jgi:superfamily II DNA/RNA helicase
MQEAKEKEEDEQLKPHTSNSDFPHQRHSNQKITYRNCEVLRDFIVTPLQRVSHMEEEIRHYKFIIPKVVAKPVEFIPSQIVTKHEKEKAYERFAY